MDNTNLTSYERKNYVMNDKQGFVILKKIKIVEKKELDIRDKEIIKLIRTKLKRNWRLPLTKFLDRLIKKY